ncbi:hypothetical protein [Chryseobacterium sp. MFBS3-17]|uniref:hypothetical protein n=1 Tax=Chryseobacterium sp. MFBS3-17 TaxID=2886689 RepID=UPI001D0DEEC4|nr:hypothetical protein [Chryseobacterium sp. MFBS3-17]MCC2591534.1 hypothetical protein [Chryseobacterium sp. MFBS3-17]
MDKEYMITMNSNDWYMREKSSGTISYPIHAGNIVIHNYGYASGTLQVFPQYWPQDYYAGDLSFDFQQIP